MVLENAVKRIMQLNETISIQNIPHEVQAIQRQINALDKEINPLVYKLYGLTDEEIKIVEESLT